MPRLHSAVSLHSSKPVHMETDAADQWSNTLYPSTVSDKQYWNKCLYKTVALVKPLAAIKTWSK